MDNHPNHWQGRATAELKSAVDLVTKSGAAITFTALGTAFLFDSVFFWMIDGTLLELFSMTDHIETAVKMIAALILLIGSSLGLWFLILRFGVWMDSHRQKNPARFFFVTLCLAFAGITYSLWNIWNNVPWPPWGEPVYRQTPIDILLSIVCFLLTGWMFATNFGETASPSHWKETAVAKKMAEHPVKDLAMFWVLITVAIAAMTGSLAADGKRPGGTPVDVYDLVMLDGELIVAGNVIRLLDKGIIYRTGDGRITFFPRERIRRLDRNLPKQPPLVLMD